MVFSVGGTAAVSNPGLAASFSRVTRMSSRLESDLDSRLEGDWDMAR